MNYIKYPSIMLLTAYLLVLGGFTNTVFAQAPLTRLTTGSPLARAAGTGANYYNGVAWVDIDNDGDMDCIYADDAVYINDGAGNLGPTLTG